MRAFRWYGETRVKSRPTERERHEPAAAER
jgi:hypothetical protein